MMQSGVCLRRDTETTLPELTEQHRIRRNEEELSGLESAHMAEKECAAPGLNILEPECVTAHSGVSDVHHTHTSMIKTETDLDSTHTGDLNTENLDSTDLGYVTHLHPDQIKTEPDDGGYVKAEHSSDLQHIMGFIVKSDQMKCESSERLVSDLMNTEMNGAAVDHNDQTVPGECAEEPNANCKKEEIHDLPTQCGDVNPHRGIINENNQTRIVQGPNLIIDPMVINSSKNPSRLNFFQKKMIQRNNGENKTGQKLYRCTQCEKSFHTNSNLDRHMRIHRCENPNKCIHCGKCFSKICNLNS
ncbi:hypothetical protein SKAU_G00114690, partial [Synaphobranchus kaupii]